MEQQWSFTDIEYSKRRHKTRREEFLEKMDCVIPWGIWTGLVEKHYPKGERGRKHLGIEVMLRMLLLQTWFNLSDEGIEDSIYDSYAMKSFLGIDFNKEQVPDATTLCKFRKLLNENGLQEQFFGQFQEVLKEEGKQVRGGTIVDATIVEAPDSKKNQEKHRDEEMHSVKKHNKWYFGMRVHIGGDSLHGFVHSLICTPANTPEVKVAPALLRLDDTVVYGNAGYLKLERYVEDGQKRTYQINRQEGTFKRHYGDGLGWREEQKLERRKSSVRCKVEYVFHVVKNLFGWQKQDTKEYIKTTVMQTCCLPARIYTCWQTPCRHDGMVAPCGGAILK